MVKMAEENWEIGMGTRTRGMKKKNLVENVEDELNVFDITFTEHSKNTDQDVYLQKLGNFVASIFNESHYSDIDILLEDGHQISAHKVILASRSEDWGVEDLFSEQHLDLSYLKYEVGYTLMRWVYTNIIQLEKEDLASLTELLKISTKFKLNALTECCEEAITVYIDQDNVKSYLHLATELLAYNLKEYCTNYLDTIDMKIEKTFEDDDDDNDEDDDGEDNDYSNHNDDQSDNDFITEPSTKTKKKKSTKDNLSCFYCCTKFKTTEELQEHETRHKDVENPFECTICGLKEISNRRRLLRHVHAHNPNSSKKKKCNVCEEVFSNALNLKLHKKTHHPGTKPHKCEYCNKPYKKRCDLEIHVRTHTGERPYTCEVCGKAFRDVGTLRMHVRTHNPNKPFVCDTCGAAFISVGSLNSHAKNHDEEYRKKSKRAFICNICGHTFAQSFYLKTHEKIHSGEKPHQCNHCGKTFTDRSSFRRHNKIHTGEKPHRCDICGKSFIQRIQLTKHRPTHEKPNEVTQTHTQPQIVFTDKLDNNMSADFSNKHNFIDQLYHVIS